VPVSQKQAYLNQSMADGMPNGPVRDCVVLPLQDIDALLHRAHMLGINPKLNSSHT
jgi:hypothetical protein